MSAVIGSAGTDAFSVQAAGNAVNSTGFASASGATTLTSVGSTGTSSFNFNTGFADNQNRTSGSSPNSGSQHVYVDRGYNSGGPVDLILDRNNNGIFTDEADNVPGDANTHNFGFGLHADGFITFDLAVIRTNQGLAANTAFTLAGGAGVNNNANGARTSGAIVLDSSELAVFDWQTGAPYRQFDSFSLSIPGNARYLTFVALTGMDNNIGWDHVSFADVQLTSVPEPETAALVLACAVGAWIVRRRATRRNFEGRTSGSA